LSDSMGTLTALRVLQALGGCGGVVIGRAIVRDRCEPHEAARAYSTLMLIVSLGPIIAPTLGGWVITISGWRAVFLFQAAGGIALVIAMHTMLRESRDPKHVVPLRISTVLASYAGLLAARRFVGYSLVGGFGMAGLFCFVTGSPIVMAHVFGLTPPQFGYMIGLNGIAFLSASQLNIHALQNSTPSEVLARAVWWPLAFTSLLTIISFFIAPPLGLVIALQFCFFISVGRLTPTGSALALAPYAREAGSASALMGALQSALGMLAGVAVALFSDGTLFRLALLLMISALLSVLSYLLVGTEK
jgi:DHA1 family bicyclomycin/chloramphenicol resistance-like MFS transporter